MRVAVDVTPLLGAVTGVGQSVRGLLAALPAAAPEVEVARWELTRRALPLPPRVLVRLWARLDHPRADRWLPAADVVHGTNFVVPPVRGAATVTVHDCWCARFPRCCDPTIAAATATVRRAVARGAWLHTSTEWGAGEVRELYGAERVRVVPFGVPEVAEAGPPPVDGPYVLALGGSDHRKGHDVLREAMREVTRELPELQLVVAGDGQWVDDATRAALLRGATVLAYPSRYEGFGFPVLEAMSVGVPVVASAVGGVPEVAGDAALLVVPDDPGALAAALRTAVTDDAERGRLVAAGHERVGRFSWEAHARGMAELWRTAWEAAR
jgi:glycosyltransferase involved in cell wall biosynthesis